MIGKELQERNRYIGALNKCEADINKSLSNLDFAITNPTISIKEKLHEMEDLFHKHEMEFYTSSPLGQLIRDFLLLHLHDTINIELMNIVNFESKIRLCGIRLPIKNLFLKALNKRIEEIKNFEIDENLPETLGKYATNESLVYFLLIDDDLEKLGYSDLVEKVSEKRITEMLRISNTYQKKMKK